MADQEKAIHKYVDEKRELQKLVLQIIEDSDYEDETDFQNLITFLDTHQYKKNKPELYHFLHLLLNISINHHRQLNFFEKIEKILLISSDFYKPVFSKMELFTIFQQSKPILLSLLKTKIVTIDDEISFKYLIDFAEFKENEVYYYFYPEINTLIKSGAIEGVNEKKYNFNLNEDIEKFETNRQNYENESKLCSMIREDLIVEFIQYINKMNISPSSQIKRSIFETNSMLIENEPTLIEYAAFFGSIQIIKYLEINKAEIKPSLWLYAVHSNNPEIISFLEDRKIEMDDRTFSEAIKCHHNSIAQYILDNYLNNSNIKDLSDESVLSIFSSANFEFIPYEFDGNKIFFSLCKNEYYELVNLYLTMRKQEIENYVNQQKPTEIQKIIEKALNENKLDVAYHLMSELDCIPDNYFKSNDKITKISLPPTIQSIGKFAFRDCSSLTSISIPSSVTSIGNNVFLWCKSLKDVSFPLTITKLDWNTFKACSSLEKFIIPLSVTSMEYAFEGCSSLKRIVIPSSVTKLGYGVFIQCEKLTELIIPPSVTEIGMFLCRKCKALKKVSIPSSVKFINEDSFRHCHSLERVIIPSSVTHIGLNSFNDCKSLKQIKIPHSVTSIREYAFYHCDSLEEVVIPPFLDAIAEGVFSECSSLKRISIPNSVVSIGEYAFCGCTSLTDVLFSKHSMLKVIDSHAFYDCKSIEQIQLPQTVLGIAPYAFVGCSSLKHISTSSIMKLIGSFSFNDCSSLIEFSIPSSIEMMGKNVFNGCSSLKKITLPSFINKDELGIESDVTFTII